jgi:hypothetical protein
MPESLAPFSIRKTKPFALSRMIDDLTWPLMSKGVEYGNPKGQPMKVRLQEIPLHATAMHLASDIVQQANPEAEGEVLKKRFEKDKGVMLFFPRRPHIDDPEDPIMAA